MADIFICYSRKDSTLATRLRDRLRAQGWDVFMDLHVEAGHRWLAQIQQELAAARAVLALWSLHSVDRRYVLDEANDAADRNILFPARIDDVPIPLGFRQFQTLNLIGWNGEGHREEWENLLGTLRKHLGAATAGKSRTTGKAAEPETPRAEESPKPVRTETTAPRETSTTRDRNAGKTFRDRLEGGGEGPLMVVIPAGRFLMGSPPGEPGRFDSEGPQHEVVLGRPFALGVYAVTFDEYDRFCDGTGRQKPDDNDWGRGTQPVINVSWSEAQDYGIWLSAQTRRSYRLPSEAEWEYAARAGTNAHYWWGTGADPSRLNCAPGFWRGMFGKPAPDNRQRTVPVHSFNPNRFGLYQVHGNVWEWCQDRWHGNYEGAPADGSAWESGDSSSRVLRGGAWSF